ncbi:MAG: hypothetical protein RR931_07365 [Mucinivorans sp.]
MERPQASTEEIDSLTEFLLSGFAWLADKCFNAASIYNEIFNVLSFQDMG